MIQHTAIQIRLYPTAEQGALMEKTFGCCRWLWNRMLSDEENFYAATGEHFLPTPARYKKEAPFLKEVNSQALAAVHQNLRRAFRSFFSQPEVFRYPQRKRKKNGRQSYTIPCQHYPSGGSDVYLTEDGVRLPKMGIVPAKIHRRPLHWWKLKAATVSRSPAGRYFCSLLYEYPEETAERAEPKEEQIVTLRFSPEGFYTDQEGFSPRPPKWLAQSQQKLARMQRRLAGMERGSNRYQAQLRKIQLLHEHIANQRKDFAHKESRRIANAWEGARAEGPAEGDRQAAAEAGWGRFCQMIDYKLRRQGKPPLKAEFFP